MTDARGFLPDGNHIATGVARDPGGFDREGNHISQSAHTSGLRQPRATNGQFAEKLGTEAEISLSPVEDPVVGVLGETPSQYARRSARFEQLLREDLRIDEETSTEEYLRSNDIDSESVLALMHAAVEQEQRPENIASLPEVDALYAQAFAAEKRLVDRDLRSLLDEHRPGTRSVIVTTWSGSDDMDFIAFENKDGSIDPDTDKSPAIAEFYSKSMPRVARLVESGSVPRVEPREVTDFHNRTVGNRRLHGGNFYRFGDGDTAYTRA